MTPGRQVVDSRGYHLVLLVGHSVVDEEFGRGTNWFRGI